MLLFASTKVSSNFLSVLVADTMLVAGHSAMKTVEPLPPRTWHPKTLLWNLTVLLIKRSTE